MSEDKNWYLKGRKHIWYPYTQEQIMPEPIKIVSTKGCKIILEDGRELIDGTSSWWSACHGYNHPKIIKAINEQANKMPHFMFAGTAHEPAFKLAKRLASLTKLDRCFFTDSGSTSVETAMKIAVQYWKNKGDKYKNKFISFDNGYHGDTMGCMSLCDPDDGMHKAFNDYMPKQFSLRIPIDEYDFAEFDNTIEAISKSVAGVIIEPLVQGAGGLKFYSADILAEIYRITKKHNLLFIADEVMTGFGKTGNMFACEEASIKPDIMCLGKALTAGTMTLAACMTKEDIYSNFLSDKLENALMSGPTFMANPLACAVANASLDIFESEPILQKINLIEEKLYQGLKPLESLEKVIDVRVKGAIGVIQLETNWEEIFQMREKFLEYGVWLRPFKDVVYIMPPFMISNEELDKLIETVFTVIRK